MSKLCSNAAQCNGLCNTHCQHWQGLGLVCPHSPVVGEFFKLTCKCLIEWGHFHLGLCTKNLNRYARPSPTTPCSMDPTLHTSPQPLQRGILMQLFVSTLSVCSNDLCLWSNQCSACQLQRPFAIGPAPANPCGTSQGRVSTNDISKQKTWSCHITCLHASGTELQCGD